MADELKEQVESAEVELIEGRGGIFLVHADGRQVYSKQDTGRFPEPGEVPAAIAG